MLESWAAITYVLNNLNRGLGNGDAYPLSLSAPSIEKLRFVHETIARKIIVHRDAARNRPETLDGEKSETVPFGSYETGDFYDETFDSSGQARGHTALLVQRLASMTHRELRERQGAAERALLTRGITFNVYGSNAGVEKIMPFDILPRVVSAGEWRTIERGLVQRVRALNAFVDDVYGARKILAAGVIPSSIVESATSFLPACVGMQPPKGIWCHVVGTDLVRDRDGQIYVLEDNLRCPSGVSYVLENRQVMKRTFPQVFEQLRVRPVDNYAGKLLETLQHLSTAALPHRRGAHARRLQLGLLRALVPRAADGRRARRGPRPRRDGRPRPHADDERLQARRRHLPAHRRHVPRSRRAPRRLDARRARPARRVPQRQGRPRERARHRRRRRQGHLHVRPEDDRVLPRREADPAERADVPLRERQGPRATCSRTWRSSS